MSIMLHSSKMMMMQIANFVDTKEVIKSSSSIFDSTAIAVDSDRHYNIIIHCCDFLPTLLLITVKEVSTGWKRLLT
eukprot:scaffold113_cov89-Skeletonema_menzelii.AAC.2